jgi:hypothetical protein
MADEYSEVTKTTAVPHAVGLTGILRLLEGVLKLPRVQEINITLKEIRYRYFLKEGETERTLDVDLDTLMPAAVIRNSKLEELVLPVGAPTEYSKDHGCATVILGKLFNLMARDRLHPVAFVVGPNTALWEWYSHTAGFMPVRKDELHGVPLLVERAYEEQTLVLCASYTRSAALVDTQNSYKVVIPKKVSQ